MQSVTGPPDAVVAGVKADHRIESGRQRLITVDKNASAPRVTKRNRGGLNNVKNIQFQIKNIKTCFLLL